MTEKTLEKKIAELEEGSTSQDNFLVPVWDISWIKTYFQVLKLYFGS